MKQILRKLAKLVLCGGVFATSLIAVPAVAQIVIVAPPPAYIATARPVFHGGHHAYWYNGRWVYGYGGRWHAYQNEPEYLRTYRVRAVPVRTVYGPRYYHRWHR